MIRCDTCLQHKRAQREKCTDKDLRPLTRLKEREETYEDELLANWHELPRRKLGPIIADKRAKRTAQAYSLAFVQQACVQQRNARGPQRNSDQRRGAHSQRR